MRRLGRLEVYNRTSRPWWQVDLGLVHAIREIHVRSSNATCCATANPRKGFYVYVSTAPLSGSPPTSAAPISTTFVSAQAAPGRRSRRRGRPLRPHRARRHRLAVFGEVQVWTTARGSIGGHAYPSTNVTGGSADWAIDLRGSSPGVNTQTQTEPFWELDLGGVRNLDTVRVWADRDALPTYNLFVSTTPFTATTVVGLRAQSGVSGWVTRGAYPSSTTATMRAGRYVRIMLDGQSAITNLREVEIVSGDGIVVSNPNGELYLFNLGTFALPAASWPQGGVNGVYYEAIESNDEDGESVLAKAMLDVAEKRWSEPRRALAEVLRRLSGAR